MFKQIKTHNILLAYLYFDKYFKIRTNARDLKLGSVFSHEVKPITVYNRKVNNPQTRYTVT